MSEIKEHIATKLVPQLRFKEFDGEWERLNLKQLIKDLQSGISVNSEDRPIANDSEFGILKTSSVANGVFSEIENKKIVDEEITRAKLNPTKDEIIISRMNTPQLVGESGYIDKTYPNLFVPDRLWQTVTYAEICHNRWLSYFLITDRVRYNLKSIATGTSGTMKNISKPNFLGIKVNCPSLPEQQKIASFLSAVDEKIQQLTKKKELLEQYKKGVMQQLFSGQLRFKDENGNPYPEWKIVKLGEYCKFSQGIQVDVDLQLREPKNGYVRFLRIENYTQKSQDFRYIPEELAGNKRIEKDEIAVVRYGATAGFISRGFEGVLANNLFKVIPLENKFTLPYLYEYLNSYKAFSFFQSEMSGGAMPALSFGIVKALKVPITVLEEQQKIATYLSSIDTKIEAVNNQITQTQTFKKGLLQQMFVAA